MPSRRSLLKLIAGSSALSLAGLTPRTTRADDPLKVAFVYISPANEPGWSFSHDQGRLAIEAAFPDVETAYAENVSENPTDAERVIRDFAQNGYKLIFTTSFGYMDPTLNVASEFPDVKFVHISGYKTADNVATAFGKIEEPRYVSGIVAGSMSQSGIIGYVAAYPIPEVIRGINAFTLGVRQINPAATVKVIWTSTWFDPPKERAAADVLLDAGADVIAQHQDTAAPALAAQDRGKFAIGYHVDMAPAAPGSILTSAVWNWGAYYVPVVQSVLDGTWTSTQYWGGWQDGVVDLAPLSALVPADIADPVTQIAADFKNGTQSIFTIFTGPLLDQTGTERVATGTAMTDADLLSMDWFVQGVEGELPT